MTDQPFLTRLRLAIEQNGGRPPGEGRFYRESGLTRNDLWQAGYDNYGAACKAAGYQPNTLQQRFSDEQLFRPLALLTRKLGRFPAKGALEVQRKRDPSFPSWEAFKRREKQGPPGSTLQAAFAAWCRGGDEFADILGVLEARDLPPQRPRARQRVVKGSVYLMRYGSSGTVYKIGRSENVPRRHAQISMVAPQEVRVIHSIPTDDPEGIERYWLTRFEDRRLPDKKELFRLTQDDVAAFRSRSYQ